MFTTCLDNFPEAVVLLGQDQVLYVNAMAAHYLPHLTKGAPIPEALDLPGKEPSGAGIFSAGSTCYTFSRTAGPEGVFLFFRPAPQTALTDLQLEGTLRQLRSLLGEVAMELGPHTANCSSPPDPATLADFSKSYHRMFRLVSHLDYMRQAGTADGVPFRASSLDLVSLCSELAQSAATLLQEVDIRLDFDCSAPALFVNADGNLLRVLLLNLIANSAQAAKGGSISLRLRRQGSRVLLQLSDSGLALSPRELAALLQQDSDQELPLPGQGAGLGLTIARHIVRLHQGSLLVEWGAGAPSFLIALPVGTPSPRVSVETPRFSSDGGLNPLLVGLSDVLPASVFSMEGLE